MKEESIRFRYITHIVTHYHPHLDEYLATLIFLRFGGYRAHFASNLTYQEIVCPTFENLEESNPTWLLFGVGGGRFDDHGPRKEKSCSQLVCEFLGLQNNLRLAQLVHAVSLQDKQGGQTKNRFTLPRMINQMHRQGLMSREEIREWAMQALSAILDSEAQKLIELKNSVEGDERRLKQLFASHTRSWFYLHVEQVAKLMPTEQGEPWLAVAQKVQEQEGKNFSKAVKTAKEFVQTCDTRFGTKRILSIDASGGEHSEYEIELDSASRVGGVSADLVLLRNSKGHTMISVNQKTAGFNLAGLVASLRKNEASKRGIKISKEHLIQEGSPEEHPQWYVHEGVDFGRVYNGTTTRPIVDLTELPFEEIHRLLFDWLEVKRLSSVA
jgi:hypothetical protein